MRHRQTFKTDRTTFDAMQERLRELRRNGHRPWATPHKEALANIALKNNVSPPEIWARGKGIDLLATVAAELADEDQIDARLLPALERKQRTA